MSAPRKETDEVESNNGVNDSGESSSDESNESDENEKEGEQTSGLDNVTADQNGGTNVLRGTSVKEFCCDICLQPCKTPGGLKNHIHQMHEEEAQRRVKQSEEYFRCPVGGCKKAYVNYQCLNRHLGSKHSIFKRNDLIVRRYRGEGRVERKTTNNDLLREHRAVAHPPEPHCYVCGEQFDTGNLLINHQNLSTCGDGESRFSRQKKPETKKRFLAANEDSDSENDGEAGPGPSKKSRTPTKKIPGASHAKTSKNASSAEYNLSVKKELRTPLSKRDQVEQEPMPSEISDREANRLEEERIKKLLEREKARQIKKDEKIAWRMQKKYEDELLYDEDDQTAGNASGGNSDPILSAKKDNTATPNNKFSETRSPLSSKRMKIEPSMWTQDVGNRSMAAEVGSPRSQQLSDTEEKTTSKNASSAEDNLSVKKEPLTPLNKASNGESSLHILPVKSEPSENHQNNRRASIVPTLGSPVARRLESLQNEVPTDRSNVEYSSLPLLAAMGGRAQHAKELLVVWNPTINEDLLLMASNKAANIILCVHSTEVVNMSPQARELWKHTHQTQFFITTSNGKGTSWTAMAVSAQLLPETLRNSFYDQIQKVEAEFRQMADSLQMEMINFVIFGTEGLFPVLSTSFVNKTIATNRRQ